MPAQTVQKMHVRVLNMPPAELQPVQLAPRAIQPMLHTAHAIATKLAPTANRWIIPIAPANVTKPVLPDINWIPRHANVIVI